MAPATVKPHSTQNLSMTNLSSTVYYFYYDGLMRRYAMEDSAGLTNFVWDKGGLNLLAEKDSSGNVTAEYIHGYSPVTGIGSLVAAKKTAGETTYYQYPQYDHRGTVVGLTDKTGAVIASYEYNAFGEVISADESAEVQAAGNRFRYQSNWMVLGDSGDRFYLTPTRVYDTATARFLSRDHLRLNGRYRYARQNPMRYVDANGFDEQSIGIKDIYEFYEKIKPALEDISGVEFPKPPAESNVTADWGQLFNDWFFEKGLENREYGEENAYSKDLFNSPSMKEIKDKFCKDYNSDMPNPWKGVFSFTGPGTATGKYTIVEWFVGSYSAEVTWHCREKDNCFDVEVSAFNVSSWRSGTRLPPSWQQRIKDLTGLTITELVTSAPRGKTIVNKLEDMMPSGMIKMPSWNPFSNNVYWGQLPLPAPIKNWASKYSFGGNMSQNYKMKGVWCCDKS